MPGCLRIFDVYFYAHNGLITNIEPRLWTAPGWQEGAARCSACRRGLNLMRQLVKAQPNKCARACRSVRI
jgi:hypothetical protein